MKQLLRTSLIAISMIVLALSCTKHDPSYDDVTPPVIDIASFSVSGYVYETDGNPIAGAKVGCASLGDVTTDKNGYYSISVKQQGEYSITASSDGCFPRTASISLSSSKGGEVNLSQDFVLPKVHTVSIVNGQADAQTEAIPQNNKAIIDLDVTIDLPESEKLEIAFVPIYDAVDGGSSTSAVKGTKAGNTKESSEMLLCGLTITTPGRNIDQLPSTLTVSIGIDQNVNNNIALKQYKNGEWVNYTDSEYKPEKGLVFDIVDVTSYGVFANVNEILTKTSESLNIEPRTTDNLYGQSTIHGCTVTYSQTSGINIDPSQAGDQLSALLLEKLVAHYGLNETKTTEGQKSLDIDIPVGTAVDWTGTQTRTDIIYSCSGSSASGSKYTDININAYSYNRKHTGGSSL